MNPSEKLELLKLLEEKERRVRTNKLRTYFPDRGPLRRELYPKHMAFFKAGATHRERLFLGANRIGKTEGTGGFEMALHLTGDYPDWWEGRRFDRPIKARASGDTAKTVRDILQEKLMGPITDLGTGLIPQDAIVKTTPKQGISNAFDMVFVKHKSGGISRLQFKSYDQGRESFQGEEIDLDWLDEESPVDIYVECLLRTMTNNGMVICTFTPLQGLSEMVMLFLPNGQIHESDTQAAKFVVTASWDDCPHLSQKVKDELWAAIPPFQRDARSKGVPQLGSGAIYPVPESDFIVDDFEVPQHWPRAYALDVGWNRTAAIWGAIDRESDTLYLYSEHYRGEAEPSIHAQAVKARGDWIPGVIDPASRGRSQADGLQLLQQYIDLGLNIDIAFNGVESGIYEVWQRLSTGRLKVFKSLSNWRFEFRLYRRDEKGRIVKQHDHLMDTTRYHVMSGIARAIVKPVKKSADESYGAGGGSWMS